MTKLDVITGFLGAGKTTFLARYVRWLKEKGSSFCVIENEFGRAGIDAGLLSLKGAKVKEISGGCVCCTLKVTLHDLLQELSGEVDRILLEPSGLFCGDDLLDILHSPDCTVEPGMWVGIVDPMALPFMNDEDKAVLQSELMPAGSVLISKASLCTDEELSAALEFSRELLPPPEPLISAERWDSVCSDRWFASLQCAGFTEREHERRRFDHASMFQSATMAFSQPFEKEELESRIQAALDGRAGEILRIKGGLPAYGGGWSINASPGCVYISFESDGYPSALNIIGRNIDRKAVKDILRG